MIAATAAVRGLTVATRNIRYYKRFGVKTFDPFSPRA
jgi:predicted nucleic acid-binding protein